MTCPLLSCTCLLRTNYGSALREKGQNSPVDIAAGVGQGRAMLGKPEKQFSPTRAALSTCRRAKGNLSYIRDVDLKLSDQLAGAFLNSQHSRTNTQH
jgi:hypothetical protein